MRNLTSIVLLLLSILCFPKFSTAQNPLLNTEASFTSAPFSPNAAAASLHAVVPRNLSVGLPSIDIPVCMLGDQDISVPVTLQYHPDAVKPDEHPGWVGLGWHLEAGGSIVRITKGQIDEAPGGYYDNDRNYLANWTATPLSNDNDGDGDNDDYEPDEFVFNFAGYSGKFYYNHLGEWVFTTNSGEHFEMTTSPAGSFTIIGDDFGDSALNGSGYGFTSFTITTNTGTQYTFGGTNNSVEYTRPVTGTLPSGYQAIPTTWHLAQIESVNGNVVTFDYQRFGAIFRESVGVNLYTQYANVGGNFDYTNAGAPSACNYNTAPIYHIIYPSYLSVITGTDANTLEFILENSNQGNYGMGITILGLAEDNYSLYPKLTGVILKRDGVTEKEMQLVYNDGGTTPENRLMLERVFESTGNGLPGYSFNYNESEFPAYNSLETDHWGYYNGFNYFTSPNPPACNSSAYVGSPDQYISALPASYLENSLLTGITYPMGGYKEFEYEGNTYTQKISKNYTPSTATEGSYTFGLTAENAMTGGLRIKSISTYEAEGSTTPLTQKTYGYEDSGIMGYTDYGLERGYFSDDYGNVIKYWHISHNNINSLRHIEGRHICYSEVKEIQADGGYKILSYSNYDNNAGLNVYGTSTTPATDEAAAAHDGSVSLRTHSAPYASRYRERGKLLQEGIYKSDGTLLRKTENTYTIVNDDAYAVRCINRHFGILIYETDLIGLIPINYDYTRATAYQEYIYPIHLTEQNVTRYDEGGGNGIATTRSFEYDYAVDDNSSSGEDMSDDNNLRQSTVTNSDGKIYYTTYKYTTDFTGTSVSDAASIGIELAKDNDIFLPVETLQYFEDINGTDYIIGGHITTYRNDDNNDTPMNPDDDNIVPFETYRLTFDDTDGNLDMITTINEATIDAGGNFIMDARYEPYMTYSAYSSTGKPQQSTQAGGTPDAILLSDDELRTVASVANAAHNEIAFTSFEDYDNNNPNDGGWTISGSTTTNTIFGTQALIGNFNVTANVPVGDYHVAFWTNGGTATVNGTPFPNDPLITTDNGWSYYQMTITLAGNVEFSGIGIIDELRLYPSDALMTTTTHDLVTHQALVTADENGKPTFYEYDEFERLVAVHDQDGNLITDYEYNYRQTGSGTQNYNRIHNHWVQNAAAGLPADNNGTENTQYMDGLGRPIQNIMTRKSPTMRDIVQVNEYDTDGRSPNQYQPFTWAENDGDFLTYGSIRQYLFHRYPETQNFEATGVATSIRAYQQTEYESSPMHRPRV